MRDGEIFHEHSTLTSVINCFSMLDILTETKISKKHTTGTHFSSMVDRIQNNVALKFFTLATPPGTKKLYVNA